MIIEYAASVIECCDYQFIRIF